SEPRIACPVNFTHSAHPKQRQHLILTEHCSRLQGNAARRRFKDSSRNLLIFQCKERLHFLAQSWVFRTRLSEESGTMLLRQLQRVLKYNFDLLPALRRHAHAKDPCAICFLCHNRAVIHSRFTVAGETPRATAVS